MELHQNITLTTAQAKKIRAAIARSGATQTAVAEAAGMQRQNLSGILAGRRSVSAGTLGAICQQVGLRSSVKIIVSIERK